jgi:hypothetical protein
MQSDALGASGGLTGRYYENKDLSNLKGTRVDPTVNFNWQSGSPYSLGVDTYSIRWTGQVKADFNEQYTFHVKADDGVRLWVNNQLIVDYWKEQYPTERSGTISLQAGKWYPIKLEYYENVGQSEVSLWYSSKSTSKRIVPSDHLRPEGGSDPGTPSPSTPTPAPSNPTPAPTTPPTDVQWSSGLETGNFSEWEQNWGGGIFNTGTGNASVSSDVAHSGRYSAKMAIDTSSGGPQAVRIFRWNESRADQSAYYRVWYYFPQQYSGMNWWNVFQWKSKTPSRNDAFWQLNVGNRPDGTMNFYVYNWVNSRSYSQSVVNIPVGRWFRVDAFYTQSSDNNGRVTFWQDGVKFFDMSGVNTKYPDGDVQWAVANYTDGISPSKATIYVDDAAISTNPIP